jgi:hypothetical protein
MASFSGTYAQHTESTGHMRYMQWRLIEDLQSLGASL